MDESFVEWRVEVPKAHNAFALAERLRQRAAKRQRNVLDGVVIVDPCVAGGVHLDVEQPV